VTPYPFSAVVGLDDLRLALVLNAVSPAVGGVLVRGEKGTAKSTVVRALAALLPGLDVVTGCRFSCDPAAPDPRCPDGPHSARAGLPAVAGEHRPARLVELPVGATEDRLVGSLDLERALTEGVKAYEPGLLAAAHRGVLYVDEVNLLSDSLVDLLLDAAAMGASYVEREGVSVRHAARLLLVGTMNPEEGELRPQLLDRFGLTVEVRASREPAERAEVVRRRLAYEADPDAFAARWAAADGELAERIAAARARLPQVELSGAALLRIAHVCAAFDVDGMRADLVTARAAVALAAWHGHPEVTEDDVRQAALLALPHRRRRNPFDAPGLDPNALDDALRSADREAGDAGDGAGAGAGDGAGEGAGDGGDGAGEGAGDAGDGEGPEPPERGPGGGRRAPEASEPPGTAGAPEGAAPSGGEQPAPPGGERHAVAPTDRPAAPSGQPAAPAAEQPAVAPAEPYRTRLFTVPGSGSGADGRRSRAVTSRGRTSGGQVPRGRPGRLHVPTTLTAAAPHQLARGRTGAGLRLHRDDVREAVREGREGNLVLFAVDASGSMAARARMSAVKGAVLSLLLDAYQRRDKVGLVTFRGRAAEVALPPTWSVEAAAARLRVLPTGGRTPLAAGLLRAGEVLRVERLRDPARRPLLVVVTDGRATGGPAPAPAARLLAGTGLASVVVDCEAGPVRLGLAGALAADLGATLVRLDDLSADALAGVARGVRSSAKGVA